MEAKSERRSVVASGKTVEDAITNGLIMLETRRDQVDVEVLSEGSRGVLGFGAENARVRLTIKAPPAPKVEAPEPVLPKPTPPKVAPPQPPPTPSEPPEQPPAREEAAAEVTAEADLGGPAVEQVGRQVLGDLLGLMGFRATVEARLGHELAEDGQPPPTVLNITGDDLGMLIGRRGETLRALQYLVRLMVSHRLKHWTDLVVDVENYRVRRRRTLENLALRVADQVAKTGRAQALEPMPPYDRRLVHIALRNHPRVATQSVGEGEKRKVTVIPRRS